LSLSTQIEKGTIQIQIVPSQQLSKTRSSFSNGSYQDCSDDRIGGIAPDLLPSERVLHAPAIQPIPETLFSPAGVVCWFSANLGADLQNNLGVKISGWLLDSWSLTSRRHCLSCW
jgi:hypothetical protein